jgi:amidophosphoribosyltransferase
MDKPEEECGVFGIYVPQKKSGRGKAGAEELADVARLTYYGLYALQHRGQESAGIAVSDGHGIELHKAMGLVADVFDERTLDSMQGNVAIGHVRYSTTGSSLVVNAQPLVFRYLQGMMALAHNGNLTNVAQLHHRLATVGSVFQSTTDSEIIVNLIARYSQDNIEDALMKCMIDIKGAYALVMMTENKLFGVRDPFGIGRCAWAGWAKPTSWLLNPALWTRSGRSLSGMWNQARLLLYDENGLKSLKTLPAIQTGRLYL